MVSNVTSLTGNGLKDWLVQRLTAVYLAFYSIVFVTMWVVFAPWTYASWSAWFHMPWFQVMTAIMLFSLLLHAWVGIWTVTTDYIKNTMLRLLIQSLVFLVLLGQLIAGLMMIWG
jgi:succinate dehydrogenase / fumarate reductase, membrane anchor subunit